MPTKYLILFTFLVIALKSNSQESRKNNFGFTVGTGKGFVAQAALVGGASNNLKQSISLGINYDRQINNVINFESGLFWYKNQIATTPNFYPGIDMTPKTYDLQLIYVPLFFRINFAKRLYINGGIIGDIDITKNSTITKQNGIGTGLGIGMKFTILNKLSLHINPYINLHGTILVKKENYPERIFDNGIQISIRTI